MPVISVLSGKTRDFLETLCIGWELLLAVWNRNRNIGGPS